MNSSPQRGNSNGSNQQLELQRIESLCNTLYNGDNPQQQQDAQAQLNLLQSSVSQIPLCQYVLDNSQNPYAILVASEALTKLVTNSWNHFKTAQRIVIRDYLLSFLGKKGPQLAQAANFVVTSIIKLLCRITRLGWFDDEKHQDLTNQCKKFLQATVPHCIIGLQILEELTVQMNLKQANETVSQQRKHAVNYRDASLLATFQIALTMLQQLLAGKVSQATPEQILQIKKRALGLGIRCLSFDFIGMQPDDSIEDNETIQIPSTWRSLVVDPATMQLMTRMYLESEPAQATLAMELLMLWSSCRRSVFVREEDRTNFLSELMNSILMILKSKQGLSHEQNYHAFCRLLGRIKNNFQLTELLQANQWTEFSKEITAFTVQSFQNWQWSKNSTHYLLHLWNRLVSVSPFVRDPDQKIQPLIDIYVPQVFQTYVVGRLQSVEDCAMNEALENPLDEDSTLQQQLQQIPNLTRYQYANSGAVLTSTFEPISTMYQSMCTHLMQNGLNALTAQNKIQLTICEGKLTWLVYIIGAQIGGHMTMASAGREGGELVDAQMARGVFQLMGVVDQMMSSTQGQLRCDRRLEKSLLYFFTEFRRCYVGEHHGMPSAKETALKKKKEEIARIRGSATSLEDDQAMDTSESGTSGDSSTLARSILMNQQAARMGLMGRGSSRMAPNNMSVSGTQTTGAIYGATGRLLQSGTPIGIPGGGVKREKTKTTAQRKREMYVRMFETMNIGDHTVVINSLVNKVKNNLTYWCDDHEIIQDTLTVFYWLSNGYGSGQFMLSLESVQSLLIHHGPNHLRFLSQRENTRERTEFYKTLARLVFIGDYDKLITPFMLPIKNVLVQLEQSLSGQRNEQQKQALIGVCRDLRGIFSAALGSHTYGLLFNNIYPKHMRPLTSAASIWGDTPEVMNPLLKFYMELVNTKGMRIKFPPSSANGILLFREISSVVVAYGNTLLRQQKPADTNQEYSHWYKGMSLCLNVMSQTLSGKYVNFGVFELYQDPSFTNSLTVSLQLLLSMKLSNIMAYPKVTKIYFQFLSITFKYHLESLIKVDTNTFVKLIEAFREGLEVAPDSSIINLCAASVDHIATFAFKTAVRGGQASHALRQHLSTVPTVFTTFFVMLLNNVMYRNMTSCWSISRPLLSLLLANENTVMEAQRQILSQQPQTNHQPFQDAFNRMMADINKTLETTNRDRFSQRVNMFRAEVKQFMVRPPEFDAV